MDDVKALVLELLRQNSGLTARLLEIEEMRLVVKFGAAARRESPRLSAANRLGDRQR
jgi:hypothetical protein